MIQQQSEELLERSEYLSILNYQINELALKVGSDQKDRQEIDILLNQILHYPSTQLAQIHAKSNRLGSLDLSNQERYKRISQKEVGSAKNQVNQICGCCGFLYQSQSLRTCGQNLQDVKGIGISTFSYFKIIIQTILLLLLMLIVFSLYSIITNIQSSQQGVEGNNSSAVLNFLSISLGSKQLYASDQKRQMYVISSWIGCGMIFLWGILFMAMKYYQKAEEVKILLQMKSVSECSLVIEKMPTGLTKADVQNYFNCYFAKIKAETDELDSLIIEKYNQGKPFYLNQEQFRDVELEKILDTNKQYKQLFSSWIMQRKIKNNFSKNERFRQRKYGEYQRLIQRKNQKIEEIIKKVKDECRKKNKQNKTTVFITFASNKQKNWVLDKNPNDFISKLKLALPFISQKERFIIEKDGSTYPVKIYPAPDPEDIVWNNIGVTNCEKTTRKLITFTITVVLLALSYVIVYGLSRIQKEQGNDLIISLLISITISVVNLLIGQVIQLLTKYQRDYTMTNYQTSLAVKSILAQLVNSIFIPIMANYSLNNNIYGQNGLIRDVFILAITNSFVPPLLKFFDIYYLYKILLAAYKCLPNQKILLHQFELNQICQKIEFQVGYEYIYIVNLYLFTCFFVSLQPIIPCFAIAGLCLMYWAQKHSLFHRCQRPVPGTKIINTTISQMLYFGGFAYTLGNLTWSIFLPGSQFTTALLPNLFASGLSLILFLFPYETIFRKMFREKRMPEVSYQKNRIYFSSEYDRLNPSTAQQGVKEFKKYVQRKKKELEEKDPEMIKKISLKLENSNRPNFIRQSLPFKPKEKLILQNILNMQSQNIVLPQVMASALGSANNSAVKIRQLGDTNLRKYRSTIPMPEFLGQSICKENESKISNSKLRNYIKQIENVDSIGFEKNKQNGRQSNDINASSENQLQILQKINSKEYFDKIANAKSHIVSIKSKDVSGHLGANALESRFSENSGHESLRLNSKYSQWMRGSFRNSIGSRMSQKSVDCCAQVWNRYEGSIDFFPLCLQQITVEEMIESSINVYDLQQSQ